jgi:hypothetical protein
MVHRQGAADTEERASFESLEIEWRPRRVADNSAGKPIIDPTALLQMAKEGYRIAEKPRPGARDRRENW